MQRLVAKSNTIAMHYRWGENTSKVKLNRNQKGEHYRDYEYTTPCHTMKTLKDCECKALCRDM